MVKYRQIEAGEWVRPRRRMYKLTCCDCGLVHVMNFRVRDKAIEFQAFRDERATGQIRRHKRRRGEKGIL